MLKIAQNTTLVKCTQICQIAPNLTNIWHVLIIDQFAAVTRAPDGPRLKRLYLVSSL